MSHSQLSSVQNQSSSSSLLRFYSNWIFFFPLPPCRFSFTSLSFSRYLPVVFPLRTCRFPLPTPVFFLYLPMVFPLPLCLLPFTSLSFPLPPVFSPLPVAYALPTCRFPFTSSLFPFTSLSFPLPPCLFPFTCRLSFTSQSCSLYLPDVKTYYYLLSSPCAPLSSKVHAPLLKKEQIKTGKEIKFTVG